MTTVDLINLTERANKAKSPYLACICGMQAHDSGVKKASNPFSDNYLDSFWNTGWDACEESYRHRGLFKNRGKIEAPKKKNFFKKIFGK